MCESRAGSGIRTGGQLSLEEGGHQGGPSSRQRVRVLQPVLRCSKEGWGATSNFRSAATEPLSQAPEVQNAYCKTGRVSDQIRGLVRHDRSKRRLFPHIHPSQSQEVPEVRFQGQSLPISGSSLRPNTLTPKFHEVRGCCTGSSATPGHPGGNDPLITRFLRGVMRLMPRVRSRVPPWDLAVVLEALCIPPFEPIEEVSR